MIQQTLAASTAIIFSLSFIPYGQGKQQSLNALNIPNAMSNVSNGPSVLPVPVATFSNFLSNGKNSSTSSGNTIKNPVSINDSKNNDINDRKSQTSEHKNGYDSGAKINSNITGGVVGIIKGTTKSSEGDPILQSLGLHSCHITQGELNHQKPWNGKSGGSVFATDIVCPVQNKTFAVYAPNSEPYYVVQHVGKDPALGDYIILKHGDIRYIFAHTENTMPLLKGGERVEAGDIIGYANVSGMSLGLHMHVEKWVGSKNVRFENGAENELSEKLCKQREWKFCQEEQLTKYYFTHYDLGDINQNDSAPCHGASGADLCWLAREGVNTMALTVDIRNKLGVKWGDKVVLEGDEGCRGIYEVHDEMAPRFRNECKKRPGTNYCIKGDLPGKPGGACTVKKITY